MKRICLVATLLWSAIMMAQAQELTPAMENVVKICSDLSTATKSSTLDQLRGANKALKAANVANFGDLWLVKGKDISVDDHLIFDEEFVDSLITNRKFLAFSSKYAKKRTSRGGSAKRGQVKMTTKALAGGKSATWKAMNRSTTEYAVVAEPDGLFTMTILDEKGKVLYAETMNNKKGEAVRRARLDLPDEATTIFVEVKNCGKNDASFALISK